MHNVTPDSGIGNLNGVSIATVHLPGCLVQRQGLGVPPSKDSCSNAQEADKPLQHGSISGMT